MRFSIQRTLIQAGIEPKDCFCLTYWRMHNTIDVSKIKEDLL